MTADEFNSAELTAGRLTPAMLAIAAEVGGVAAFQRAHGLADDGKAGPKTQAMLAAVLLGHRPQPAQTDAAPISRARHAVDDNWRAAADVGGLPLADPVPEDAACR